MVVGQASIGAGLRDIGVGERGWSVARKEHRGQDGKIEKGGQGNVLHLFPAANHPPQKKSHTHFLVLNRQPFQKDLSSSE